MEEFLTNCLKAMSSDKNKVEKLRDFLHSNWESEEVCVLSNRIVKALNDALQNCSFQKNISIQHLEVLIDSLRFLAVKSKNKSFWISFGLDMGESCIKILSLIEKSNDFEELFAKVLSTISEISENSSSVWKTTSRQILNVFINKNFSFEFMEKAFNTYILTLQKIEDLELKKFAEENMSLLRTFFAKIPSIGDFQIQESLLSIVFLHLKENHLIRSFFSHQNEKNVEMFLKFTSNNFRNACRLYLNEINKKATKRKVCSVGCQTISLGSHTPLTLSNKQLIWVDANKDTRRIMINCSDLLSNKNISIPFSDVITVKKEKPTEGYCLVTITSKVYENTSDGITLSVKDNEDVLDFIGFLNEAVKIKRKYGHKLSHTCDLIHINREELEEINDSGFSNIAKKVQINAVSSSIENDFKIKKISSDYFINSLNKNLEMRSSQGSQNTSGVGCDILQSPTNKIHKLFISPLKSFNENINPELKTSETFERKNEKLRNIELETKEKPKKHCLVSPIVECKTKPKEKLFESESSNYDCFRSATKNQNKKPVLPKLKVNNRRYFSKTKKNEKNTKTVEETQVSNTSLLDPNGYAYQRWLKPTTSKRSNFWLEKLKNLEKENKISNDSFEFCENSDTETKKKSKLKDKNKSRTKVQNKKYQLAHVSSKQLFHVNKPNKVKPVQELLKKVELKNEKKIQTKKNEQSKVVEKKKLEDEPVLNKEKGSFYKEVFECFEGIENEKETTCKKNFVEDIFKDFEEEPIVIKNKNVGEIVCRQFGFDKEKSKFPQKKCDKVMEKLKTNVLPLYEEDFASNKEENKRKENEYRDINNLMKLKIFPIPLVKIRIEKVELRAYKETEEILETIKKATDNLLDRVVKKESAKVISYLKVLERVGPEMADVKEHLNQALYLQKFKTFYNARRSLTDPRENVLEIQNALKQLKDNATNYSLMLNKMNEKLKNLMKKGIEDRMKYEVEEKKQKLKSLNFCF